MERKSQIILTNIKDATIWCRLCTNQPHPNDVVEGLVDGSVSDIEVLIELRVVQNPGDFQQSAGSPCIVAQYSIE